MKKGEPKRAYERHFGSKCESAQNIYECMLRHFGSPLELVARIYTAAKLPKHWDNSQIALALPTHEHYVGCETARSCSLGGALEDGRGAN